MKALLVLGVGAAIGLGQVASGPPQRFRSDAELVTVDVLVTHDRRPVAGLGIADFELLDNGVPQAIQQLYVEQLPLNIIMVLDTSSSMQGERIDALTKAATLVVDRLRSSDQGAIVTFSQQLDLEANFTSDRGTLHTAIRALKAEGSTALRDAAFAGIALRSAGDRRTLMILFSDGVDTASVLGEDRVIEIARRSDVVIYPVAVSETERVDALRPMERRRVERGTDQGFLKRLAAETGGRLEVADQNRDLGATFARVLEEFNRRYVLGYAPTGVAARGWHRVDVRLKNRKGTVLARRGYFAN